MAPLTSTGVVAADVSCGTSSSEWKIDFGTPTQIGLLVVVKAFNDDRYIELYLDGISKTYFSYSREVEVNALLEKISIIDLN